VGGATPSLLLLLGLMRQNGRCGGGAWWWVEVVKGWRCVDVVVEGGGGGVGCGGSGGGGGVGLLMIILHEASFHSHRCFSNGGTRTPRGRWRDCTGTTRT